MLYVLQAIARQDFLWKMVRVIEPSTKQMVVVEKCTCKAEEVTSMVAEVICSSREDEVPVKEEAGARESGGSMAVVVVVNCNGKPETKAVGTCGDMLVKEMMVVEEKICSGGLGLEVEVEEIYSGMLVQEILMVEEGPFDGRSLPEVVGRCNSTAVEVEEETYNDKEARADCSGRQELEVVETCSGTLVPKNMVMVGEDTCSDRLVMEVVGTCNSTLE